MLAREINPVQNQPKKEEKSNIILQKQLKLILYLCATPVLLIINQVL